MQSRLGLGAASLLLCVVLPRAAAQEPEAIPARIVVATREVPPFAMKNEDGERVGITIELLREVQAELRTGTEREIMLEFREMGPALEEMLDAAEYGEVDLAAAAPNGMTSWLPGRGT